MSQILDMYKQRETNEGEVEKTLKTLEEKTKKLLKQSALLKKKNRKLCQEKAMLDKQICSTELYNSKTESDILKLKTKTEETACSLELTRWKIYKTELLKELEKRKKEVVNNKKSNYETLIKSTFDEENDSNEPPSNIEQNKGTLNEIKLLREKIANLKSEIESKRGSIQNSDFKLNLDIQTLEKRNNALKIRYQRQLQEAETRLRQSVAELHSLQKLLIEKSNELKNNSADE